ncbi:MAG: NADH-quinone oxidoreductase subunit N [bacterium]
MMNLTLLTPELIITLGSLVVFAISLGSGRGKLAATVTAAIAALALLSCAGTLNSHGDFFSRALRVDLYSQIFKIFILLGLFSVVVFGRELKDIRAEIRPEYFLFLLWGTLGLMLLVSSTELITLIIAMELSSFALYLLVPLRQDRGGLRIQMEAATKYVMFGIVATGIMLFGMSYLFGLTGTTYFHDLAPALRERWSDPAAVIGMVMVLAGLFFKLAAFPMHLWAPDVYQGASNETTAFIAGVPKAAVIAVLIRFCLCADPGDRSLTVVLTVTAICSMFFGNLAALVQTDIKRMLAYSSIAHAGYVLLGLITLRDTGYAASIFYILGFVVMSLASFLVICATSREGENVTVDSLSGLHSRSPLAALILGAGMFALAGIPPFAGFMGKFFLLTEALKRGYVLLVVVAAINTAIGVYYYLTVVRVMYFSDAGERPQVRLGAVNAALGLGLILIVLALGTFPSGLLDTALSAVRTAVL